MWLVRNTSCQTPQVHTLCQLLQLLQHPVCLGQAAWLISDDHTTGSLHRLLSCLPGILLLLLHLQCRLQFAIMLLLWVL